MNLRKLFCKRKRSIFYHVSRPGNVQSILLNGLFADAWGCIYVFKDEKFNGLGHSIIADYMVSNALRYYDGINYALFRVDVGDNELFLDPSMENLSNISPLYHKQFIIRQPIIKPKYIEFLGVFPGGRYKLPAALRLRDLPTGDDPKSTVKRALFEELMNEFAQTEYEKATGKRKPDFDVRPRKSD